MRRTGRCFISSFLSLCLVVPAALSVVMGCARSPEGRAGALSRDVARAAKGMTEGAQLGSFALMDTTQYRERDPNPNPYVGELLYNQYCASCHGSGKGPDILDNRTTAPDAESDYYIIRYGLIEMKGFRDKLTKFQTLDILAYMKVDLSSFNPSDGVPVNQKPPAKKIRKQTSESASDTAQKAF